MLSVFLIDKLVSSSYLFFMLLQFSKLEDAKAAQSLNGKLELAGRTIKVGLYL